MRPVCDSPNKNIFSIQINMPTGYQIFFFTKYPCFGVIGCANFEKNKKNKFWIRFLVQKLWFLTFGRKNQKIEFSPLNWKQNLVFPYLECALQDGHKSFACFESHNCFDMPAPYFKYEIKVELIIQVIFLSNRIVFTLKRNL